MPNYKLPEGWRWSTLSEFADVINGVNYDGNEECKSGIRILRGGNIQSKNILIKDDDVFLPRKYKCDENTVRVGDTIMVASTGSVEVLGKAAGCLEDLGETQIGAFLRLIRPKNVAHAPFITALLTSDYFSRYIKASAANGTGINNIRNGYLLDFPIPVPEDGELNRISGVLSSIDSKIALNRRINQKLEETARRLYDYWFLQFDFPAPAGSLTADGQPIPEGAPYCSSGGAMSHNATLNRLIPQGWSNGELQDIANITMGQSPDGSTYNEEGNGTIFYQGCTDFGMRFPSVRMFTTAPTRFAKKGDVLMSVRAPVGTLNIANSDCCIGRGLAALNSKIGSVTHLYQVLADLKAAFDARNSVGTTFGSITKDDLFALAVVVPQKEIVEEFEKICAPIFDEQMKLGEEVVRLTALRDRLLPLLMNGQITISE